MTLTLAQMLKKNTHKVVRRCYIKRRLIDGTYESNWQRIDFYRSRNQVIDWGSFSLEIDHNPGDIGTFEISELQMQFVNIEGYWNIETDFRSIWAPSSMYLNRKLTKLKVECGYVDAYGVEIGTATVFEGVIDKVSMSEDQIVDATILPYTSILTKYLITDLSLTGSKTISQVVNAIMNQSKITTYIPYVSASPANNKTISDASTLSGTYWDVLKQMAQLSNSIPMLVGSAWSFQPRTPTSDVKWEFLGAGTQFPNIFKITKFDDEGAERVRTVFQCDDDSGGKITSTSSDPKLLLKYLNDPQQIDLSKLELADHLPVLRSYRSYWEKNRPVIDFSAKFMINILKPLDKVRIKSFGQLLPLGKVRRWGDGGTWGDGSVWGRLRGSINILNQSFMVTRIQKDIQNWMFSITAEKIV